MTDLIKVLWRWLRMKVRGGVQPRGSKVRRLRLRIAGLLALLGAIGAIIAFPQEAKEKAVAMCRALPPQPRMSDLCASTGLLGLPRKAERVAWETRPKGSCAALRAYVARYPEGFYRDEAIKSLATVQVTFSGGWRAVSRRQSGYVQRRFPGFATKGAAERDASQRASEDASTRECVAVDDGLETAVGQKMESISPSCVQISDGFACGADYHVLCVFKEKVPAEICS